MSKQYKLGNVHFIENDVALFKPLYSVAGIRRDIWFYESELLEMGAQLVEEDKPQEIEKLDIDHVMESWLTKRGQFAILVDKQNEIIEAFNTHLSECGKEKQ